MRRYFATITFLLILFSCAEEKSLTEPMIGTWQALLTTKDNQKLPFNFNLYKTKVGLLNLDIMNAEEVITVDEITVEKDSILIKVPAFDGFIQAHYTSKNMEGRFIIESMDRSVSFSAAHGLKDRFSGSETPMVDITGSWKTEFSPNSENNYMAKGTFKQNETGKVTGTFRTNTGDYRFLEGVMDHDSLKLSAFDGSHAFLFLAKATDSSLNGTFYSGNHFKEPFIAERNQAYKLASPDSLTFLKEGYTSLNFSFPDGNGNQVSLNDKKFKSKVIIIQVMGTWCPNCLDETKFLTEYLKRKNNQELEVIGLAFEYAKTEELAFRSIERLTERVGVPYPILLAQYGTSDKGKAQEKLPMLNHVLSYPTTIFIDKQGSVRKIHTGFNGPATGDNYESFKQEFDRFVTELLAE